MAEIGDIRIGISGWRCPPWRGVFYPPKLPQRRVLAFVGEAFRAVEINGTFYSLQRPEYFEAWAAEAPDDFVFAIKGSRFISHAKKLFDLQTKVRALFDARGLIDRVERRLGGALSD